MDIFQASQTGDIAALQAILDRRERHPSHNKDGMTPLLVAIQSKHADVDLVQLLLENGFDPNETGVPEFEPPLDEEALRFRAEKEAQGYSYPKSAAERFIAHSPLMVAAQNSGFEIIEALVKAGADVHFRDKNGYSVSLYAAFGVCQRAGEENQNVFRLLAGAGASFDQASKHGETPLTCLTRQFEFDLVQLVVELGADPTPLEWTPLIRSVIYGGVDEVRGLLAHDSDLEVVDSADRTPLLIAARLGKLKVLELLVERGADLGAVGRVGESVLVIAIEGKHSDVCQWLVDNGFDWQQRDEYNNSPLQSAVQADAVGCVRVLVDAGANPFEKSEHGFSLMSDVKSIEMFKLISSYGVGNGELSSKVRRDLSGVEASCFKSNRDEYLKNRERVFGRSNPERMNNSFWEDAVRLRKSSWAIDSYFENEQQAGPTWCFDRYGQSFTILPDGRTVEIGGEHEDHYDPDFCIYNEVVVYHGDGTFDIFGYPKSIFPPTDFHTATYFEDKIYIVGSLGYPEDRSVGETPVYVLNCGDWSMQKMETMGGSPGWISNHVAILQPDKAPQIRIKLGNVMAETEWAENDREWLLDLECGRWEKVD